MADGLNNAELRRGLRHGTLTPAGHELAARRWARDRRTLEAARELAEWAEGKLDAMQRSHEHPATGHVADSEVAREIERIGLLIQRILGRPVYLGRFAEQETDDTPPKPHPTDSGRGQ